MKLINQKTMKKISLQTKLEDCSVPQRYIDVIRREAEGIRTIYDLVSLTTREFFRIRFVGVICYRNWRDFLEEYGLRIGMTVEEILKYVPEGIIQYNLENGKLHSKLIEPLNCNPESNIDREQGQKFDPKTLKPFDKVLVRDSHNAVWSCKWFSHIMDLSKFYKYATTGCLYRYCIPYNDDTKHLVGTNEEAPEFYRYWED